MDTVNITTNKMSVDPIITSCIEREDMKPCEYHLKAHFDGIILFSPNNILILEVTGKKDKLKLVHRLEIDQTIINVCEFTSSYKFLGWTHTGKSCNEDSLEILGVLCKGFIIEGRAS